jgi:hypothetical protein
MDVWLDQTETGFLNSHLQTAEGQRIACSYDDGVILDQNAQCSVSFECYRFKIGDCVQQGNKPGTRTSVMSCPTNTGAGCKNGTLTVYLSNGTQLPTTTFEVDDSIATNQQCFSEFPASPELGKGVIGKLVQTGCLKGAQWSADEPVSQHIVRNDLSNEPDKATFQSSTTWLAFNSLLCAQNSGFPTGACSNDGGVWVTFPNPNPQGGLQACIDAKSQLTCGQQVVPVGNPPELTTLYGPEPSVCKTDNEGQCSCRCARCNELGTLVNLGDPNSSPNALFVLANPSAKWSAFCEVTVTGN